MGLYRWLVKVSWLGKLAARIESDGKHGHVDRDSDETRNKLLYYYEVKSGVDVMD